MVDLVNLFNDTSSVIREKSTVSRWRMGILSLSLMVGQQSRFGEDVLVLSKFSAVITKRVLAMLSTTTITTKNTRTVERLSS